MLLLLLLLSYSEERFNKLTLTGAGPNMGVSGGLGEKAMNAICSNTSLFSIALFLLFGMVVN